MAYAHGISLIEESTALTVMTTAESPCVAIGTASKGTTLTPVLIQSMDEFESAFGFTGDFDANTLEEVAYAFFTLYNVRPVIFIRVAPATGATTVTNAQIISAIAVVEEIYPRLSMVPGNIIAPKYSAVPEVALALAAKAKNINGIFKSFAVADISLPTNLLSEENPTADRAINEKAIARGDLLTEKAIARGNLLGDAANDADYTLVNAYKNTNTLTDEYLAECWPRVALGDKSYWLSTQAAALMALVDANHGQIPYESPSNKNLRADRSLVKSGAAVFLSYANANVLNSQGVVTAMNFNGWRLYGNRTSTYPTNDDPAVSFIATRRMRNWLGNTLAINYFSRIDSPLNRRLVDTILDEVNLFLNGLTAQGVLLGGRISFLEEDNSVTDLADGLMKFRIYYAAPPPARSISFVLSYDVSYFQTLFS